MDKTTNLDRNVIDHVNQLYLSARHKEAELEISKYLDPMPKNPNRLFGELLLIKANIYMDKGMYQTLYEFGTHLQQLYKELDDRTLKLLLSLIQLQGLLMEEMLDDFEAQVMEIEKLIAGMDIGNKQTNRLLSLYSLTLGKYDQLKGKRESAITHFQECLKTAEELGDTILTAHAMLGIGQAYDAKGNFEEALLWYEKAKTLYTQIEYELFLANLKYSIAGTNLKKGNQLEAKQLLKETVIVYEKLDNQPHLARNLNTLGLTYRELGDLSKALELHLQSNAIYKKLGALQGNAFSLNNIGIVYRARGELDKALEYYKESYESLVKLGDNFFIAGSLSNIGGTYHDRGDLEDALDYWIQSLEIYKETGNTQAIARQTANVGKLYWNKKELETALQYFQEGLRMRRDIGNDFETAYSLFYNILTQIEYQQPSWEAIATDLNQELQQINDRMENKHVYFISRFAEALLQKSQPRITEKVKAQEMLQNLVNEEIIERRLTIFAILHLCDLLFVELRSYGQPEVLEEIEELSNRVYSIAKDQNSKPLIVETMILQSNVALLNGELSRVEELLDQAIQMADEHHLHKVGEKAREEKRNFEDELSKWIELVNSHSSVIERVKASKIGEFMQNVLATASMNI